MSYRHLTSNIKVACSKLFKNVHFIFFHVVSIDKICYLHISLRTQLCISVCVFFLGGELTCDELLYHSGGVWLISWWWVLTSVKSIFYNDFVHVFVSYRIVKSSLYLQGGKCSEGTKPCLMFAGETFEQDVEYRRLKNLFIGK